MNNGGEAAAAAGDHVLVYADGASRGNPGPASIGAVVLTTDGRVLAEVSEAIGRATNNVAEYRALIAALGRAQALGARRVTVRMDSELVVRQLKGIYKVKHPAMVPLYQQTVALLRQFAGVEVAHVPRESNRVADALANRALDQNPSP